MRKVLIEMTEKQHQMMNKFLNVAIPETWPEGFDSAREWFWKKGDYDCAESAFKAFRKNVYKKETE
jgi:hypothetical protein